MRCWSVSRALTQRGVAAGALVLLALSIRLLHLDAPPRFDELYHYFAAQSWMVDGELRLADGLYTRASLYTRLVGVLFQLFGVSIETLRMPAVVSGSLLVGAVYYWVHGAVCAPAAWVAALLFCLWPDGIVISQVDRFYALHGVLFWLGAMTVHALVVADKPSLLRISLSALLVALCFAVALHLQLTTLIGVAGVALWVALYLGVPVLRSHRRWRLIVGVSVVAALGLIVFVAVASGAMAKLLFLYRWVPLFLLPDQDRFWYFHEQFALYYPTLWPLMGVLALVAFASAPRPAGFCLCVFGFGILAHSFAGQKMLRHAYYLMPFLFVLWGIATVDIYAQVLRFLADRVDKSLHTVGFHRLSRPLTRGIITGVALFALLANAATIKTFAVLADMNVPPAQRGADWRLARPALDSLLKKANVVVTVSELHALHALSRYDITMNRSRLSDAQVGEFGLDPRTGRPIVSTAQSLELIVACHASGLFLATDYTWRNPARITDAVADTIVRLATPVDVPRSSKVRAYYWENDAAATRSDRCSKTMRRERRVIENR